MEIQNIDALYVRGNSQNKNKNKNKLLNVRYKSKVISKSPRKLVEVCRRCEKEGHYKKGYKFKIYEKGEGLNYSPSIESKTSSNDGGEV